MTRKRTRRSTDTEVLVWRDQAGDQHEHRQRVRNSVSLGTIPKSMRLLDVHCSPSDDRDDLIAVLVETEVDGPALLYVPQVGGVRPAYILLEDGLDGVITVAPEHDRAWPAGDPQPSRDVLCESCRTTYPISAVGLREHRSASPTLRTPCLRVHN